MPEDHSLSTDRLRRLLLAVPNRRRIYEAIVRSPGIHVRRLSRQLDLALGSVEHHLHHLERHAVVFSHQDGRRRSYYCAQRISPDDVPLLHALNRPPCDDILAALVLGGEETITGVSGRIGIPTAQTAHHLRRLRDAGILQHVKVGRESIYVPRDGPRILQLLDAYFRPHTPDAGDDLVHLLERTHTVSAHIHSTGYPVATIDASMIEPLSVDH